jgi:hypothetical protein
MPYLPNKPKPIIVVVAFARSPLSEASSSDDESGTVETKQRNSKRPTGIDDRHLADLALRAVNRALLNFQDVKQFPFHLARVTANNLMAPKKPQVMTGRKRGRVVVKNSVRRKLVRRNSGASRNPTRNFGTSRKSDLPRSKDFSYRRRRRVCLVDAILFNGRFAPLYIVLDHRTTQEVDGDDSPPSKRTRRRSGAVKQEVPDDDARGSRDNPKIISRRNTTWIPKAGSMPHLPR